MGKALYRKYRSKSLSEVVGQDHITNALQKALDTKNISHAYLFTGPRGVGKTSVARILAHEINGLPYNEDEANHLDIIEIDAASNRRIDEIRDLKDKVLIAPTSAKYKVYIVDEVHMLTKEAFNALLKTLEEPPAHVVFILATTEAHKLPETIISRTQRYSFRPVVNDAVIGHLASIAKTENINIDKAALELIAKHGEGSFRDSISLLDQIRHSSPNIVKRDVENALGIAPSELVKNTLDAVKQNKRDQLLKYLEEIIAQGIDIVRFSHQLSAALREDIISDKSAPAKSDLLLLEHLSRVSAHPNPALALDIALFNQLTDDTASDTPQVHADEPHLEEAHETVELPPVEPVMDMAEEAVLEPVETKKPPKKLTEWDSVLQTLKKRYATLYGVVRMGRPTFADQSLTLEFDFPFHARRVSEERNRKLLEDILFEVLGKRLAIKANKTDKKLQQKQPNNAKSTESEPLQSVSNIFGRVEIVES